jgi:Uma2 family endonuclease
MATDITIPTVKAPPMRDGDRMTREEFERAWDAMPEVKKAELIEGVVYMTPVSRSHGTPHFDFIGWLWLYRLLTPGTEGAADTSIRFDDDNMPQPDALLRILETHGGRSNVDTDGYYVSGPELVAEISRTTTSYDLGVKRDVYRRFGVQEYVVWRVEDRAIDWFVLRGGSYTPLAAGADGVLRSEVFPGLWLDPTALVTGDAVRLLSVAQRGHGSPEHGEFIRLLQGRAGRV